MSVFRIQTISQLPPKRTANEPQLQAERTVFAFQNTANGYASEPQTENRHVAHGHKLTEKCPEFT